MRSIVLPALLIVSALAPRKALSQDSLDRSDFVRVDEAIPSIVIDLRYYGEHNFMGERIRGYRAPMVYLTREATDALAAVQEELLSFGLSIKIYDAYRPQTAVNHFIEWARDLTDTATKAEFYPDVSKDVLFDEGYISARSGHTRGSTLDLTIVPYPPADQPAWSRDDLAACTLPADRRYRDNSLDMGSGYDCFDTLSWTEDMRVGPEQRAHRLLLKLVMEKHGFQNYPREWWHYTLRDEPFTDTYFDFPIE